MQPNDDTDPPAGAAPEPGPQVYRWYVLGILTLTYAIHAMDRNIVNLLLEPIKREFHVSDSALGLLTGLGYAVPFAIAGLPLGVLIDRVNRRRLLAILLSVWSAFTALGGLAQNFAMLLATRMAVGAAESGTPPNILSQISDYFPPRLRATAVSIFYIGAPVGTMLGAFLAGQITATHGWRAALFVAAIPGFVVAVILMLTVREAKRGGQPTGVAPIPLMEALKIVRDPAMACVLAALIIGGLASVGIGAWTGPLLMRSFHLPVQDAGKLVALTGLVGACGTALGGVISDLFAKGRSERLLLLAGLTNLIALPLFLYAVLARDMAGFTPAFLAWSVIHVIYWGPGYGVALGLAPAQTRGRIMALTFVLSNILGAGMGPQIVGWLSDAFSAAGDPDALRHAVAALGVAVGLAGLLFLAAIRLVQPGVTQPIEQPV